jgi:hypothetical protein
MSIHKSSRQEPQYGSEIQKPHSWLAELRSVWNEWIAATRRRLRLGYNLWKFKFSRQESQFPLTKELIIPHDGLGYNLPSYCSYTWNRRRGGSRQHSETTYRKIIISIKYLGYGLRFLWLRGTHAPEPVQEQTSQSNKTQCKSSMLFLDQNFPLFPMVNLLLM